MSTAFIFPGQASQSVGMLADFAPIFPVVQETFAQASDLLSFDLWGLVQHGPVEQLNQTEMTQLSMLAADVALWRVWLQQNGTVPTYMAGHSLGEYAALVCADVIGFSEAVLLVQARARLMQEASNQVPVGMLVELGLDHDTVQQACDAVAQDDILNIANINSPAQVVVAGHLSAIERLRDQLQSVGAKRAMLLPMSAVSHCDLLKPVLDDMQSVLHSVRFQSASIPVLQNATSAIHVDPESIKKNLLDQLVKPVNWVAVIDGLGRLGVDRCYECGPGKVLTGLSKRMQPAMPTQALGAVTSMESAMAWV